jgi:hypothetical protein
MSRDSGCMAEALQPIGLLGRPAMSALSRRPATAQTSAPKRNGRASASAHHKNGRSRLTNHRDLLPYIADGRLTQARRFRDLVRALISDAGGVDNCSEVKLGLIRRLAALTVMSEEAETRVINGEGVDIAAFCQLASTTVRVAQRLGVERVAREIGPTLGDLLREDLRQREREQQP